MGVPASHASASRRKHREQRRCLCTVGRSGTDVSKTWAPGPGSLFAMIARATNRLPRSASQEGGLPAFRNSIPAEALKTVIEGVPVLRRRRCELTDLQSRTIIAEGAGFWRVVRKSRRSGGCRTKQQGRGQDQLCVLEHDESPFRCRPLHHCVFWRHRSESGVLPRSMGNALPSQTVVIGECDQDRNLSPGATPR